ncbi:MAG TPA: hypothetical protein VMN82_02005 [Thermoanaerobaculia bacterium]|nr:hypothetical protein [Thermoanaerobaculia bacterium]
MAVFLSIALLMAAASAGAQVNRWDTIGPKPYSGNGQGVNVYGLAFGAGDTLLAADSLGVFASPGDGTWQAALQVPWVGAIPPFYAFYSILTASGSPNIVLAGLSAGGVSRSTDGGRSWSGGLGGAGFLAMAAGSSSPQVAYGSVKVVQSFSTSRSTDYGATWTDLTSLDGSPVTALVVDPESSDIVYGCIGSSATGLPAGVYRSTDGGSSWSRLGGLPDDVCKAVAVDFQSPATVYAGFDTDGIFRSDDGGQSWLAVNEGLRSLAVRQVVVDPVESSVVYAGTGSGVFRSGDRGGHWGSIGFNGSGITSLTLDPESPKTVYAGVPAGLQKITLAPTGPCVPGPETLCLNAGRFRVEIVWRAPSAGASSVGQSFPITDDTGAFWFFDAANLEVVVKVLDAESVNGNFWVFFGALSNVEYTITVTDTRTGRIQSYYSAGGPLVSYADTSAFPGDSAAAPAALVAPPPLSRSVQSPATTSLCVPDSHTLCQLDGRFQVRVEWQGSATDPIQNASAVALTDDTGYFWFFDAANIELMVKTLDGTSVNGHYWVFSGALSNVHYRIVVTDLATNAVQTYDNPQGQLASFADTSAF